MTYKTELDVTREDRELFILLLGFDAVHSEKDFDRIHKGDFDHWKKMKAIARHRLATRTPDPTPVAKVRVKQGGYGMELATYVAYGMPEGDHWLYAHPPVAPADGLVEALTEIERRTGLLIHQNVGRWSAKVEHDLRTMNVLSVNQSIVRTALAAHRGEA